MRFEFIAGALCLDFANTIHDSRAEDNEDELNSVADLLRWATEAGLLSSAATDRLEAHYGRNFHEAAAAFKKAVAVRDLLLSLFAGIARHRSVSARRLSELTSALAQAPGTLRVSNKSGRVEAAWTSAAGGLKQVLFAVLTSAAELLASDRVGRVRECASANCTWLFVDESRNRSRRWCDMASCGNRMKARRHYRRTKSAR